MVTTRSGNKAVPSTPTTPGSRDVVISSRARQRRGAWAHAPDRATLLWFAVSLPLVAWDCGYVLLRPHTMPGGALHWPVWAPYRLYGEVDLVYGPGAYHARLGFTAAQGWLNVVESAMYLAYLYIYFRRAQGAGGAIGERRVLVGRDAGFAVLLAFSAAVMTLSKTVLYWLNEYCSGFASIGHNSLGDLILLWIIPNGAWLVLPTYMIYVMGGEIVEGLATASEGVEVKSE